ncbi:MULTISPECIES: response regulator transcription factor [Paenibacillus]|uniref:response regulator transcription factor n=1 Tax=Paenibacillus TaxID=44249 RepID=UPI001F1C3AE2|nr:response regulator transcription factor [Paenibacillus sp. JJ-223]CAH1222768.1 Alkaline phosphatase synthesis transcriptional regulatory protein PhoP [Paenibacillus sp. JJ-223]
MTKRILVVDDEQDIVCLLQDYLTMNGYMVMTAINGDQALQQASKGPDLILLDINMPDMDGLQVCSLIRNHVSCPIIFLTARVEERDKIVGFQAGADDYIVKPFSIDELGARIEAHLRREERLQAKHQTKFIGELVVDYTSREIRFQDEIIHFSKKEFEIIELLSMNQGQVFDKERIYELIWGYERDGDSAVVAEHVRRIRQKFAACSKQKYISTVWGVGYKWEG